MEKTNKATLKRLMLPMTAFALGLLIGVSVIFLVEVNPLQEQNATLSNNYNSLQAYMNTMKGENTALQANITKLKGDYNALLAKYDTLVAPQPKITMVDVTKYNARAGGFCIISQGVGADFTLVNTGRANGIAKVTLTTSVGAALAQNTYLVPAGMQIQKSLKITVDCKQTFDVALSLEVSTG